MSKYDIERIIDRLMSAASIVRSCRSELLHMGFSEKESDELLQVYVYNAICKED